jgi:hypothetical protein
MSRNAKILGYGLGSLLMAGGIAMGLAGLAGGIGPALIGTMLVGALLLEPRYGRPRRDGPQPQVDWQRTGERFFDDETKRLVEVWYNPATGERRYAGVDR